MPLASTFSLQWYGEAAGAAYLSGSGTVTPGASATARAAAALSGTGTVVTADGTRLVNSPATLTGSGTVVTALPKGRGRPTATIRIGANPSADDVAQAVWGSAPTITAEPGTMAELMRLLRILASKTVTDPDAGTMTVYDEDGTTVLYAADLFEDADGTTPYRGAGAERRERLTPP